MQHARVVYHKIFNTISPGFFAWRLPWRGKAVELYQELPIRLLHDSIITAPNQNA